MRSRRIVDRAGEIGLLQRPVRRRHRLEGHLEAALEVEAERRLLVDGRGGNREQADPDEAGDDQRHESEVRSTVHRASGRLAVDLLLPLSSRGCFDVPAFVAGREHARDRPPGDADLRARRDLEHELLVLRRADVPDQAADGEDLVADLDAGEQLALGAARRRCGLIRNSQSRANMATIMISCPKGPPVGRRRAGRARAAVWACSSPRSIAARAPAVSSSRKCRLCRLRRRRPSSSSWLIR